jgi:hypothetical protein
VGSRLQTLATLDILGDQAAEEIVRKVAEQATEGQPAAQELMLRRIWPPRQGRPVAFDLPDVTQPGGLERAHAALIRAASDGKLSTTEVNHMSETLLSHHKLTTETDLLREMLELKLAVAEVLKGRSS